MKIKSVDSISLKGTSHTECQDFSLYYQENNIVIGIVTDGCSASHKICKNTDFGARILAHQTLHSIKNIINDKFWDIPHSNPREIAIQIVKSTSDISKNWELSQYTLDATILAFVTNGEFIHFFAYGDGAFSFNFLGEEISNLYRLEFDQSAPFYPNYFNNTDRLKSYLAFDQAFEIDKYEINGIDVRRNNHKKFNRIDTNIYNETYWHFNLKETPLNNFMIYSDGIFTQSFSNIRSTFDLFDEESQKIMVGKFETQIEDGSGEFIKRQFINENKKRSPMGYKWNHYDDLSVVGVSFNP